MPDTRVSILGTSSQSGHKSGSYTEYIRPKAESISSRPPLLLKFGTLALYLIDVYLVQRDTLLYMHDRMTAGIYFMRNSAVQRVYGLNAERACCRSHRSSRTIINVQARGNGHA